MRDMGRLSACNRRSDDRTSTSLSSPERCPSRSRSGRPRPKKCLISPLADPRMTVNIRQDPARIGKIFNPIRKNDKTCAICGLLAIFYDNFCTISGSHPSYESNRWGKPLNLNHSKSMFVQTYCKNSDRCKDQFQYFLNGRNDLYR